MLARIRKSAEKRDQGFTLIELLVVMIIIGILAAIAIPVFLSQRAKARDTSTKSDVASAGKEISSYYVDGAVQLYGTIAGTTLSFRTAASGGTVVGTVNLSSGTALITSATTAVTYPSGCTNYQGNWIVGLTNPNGSQKDYYYSATAA